MAAHIDAFIEVDRSIYGPDESSHSRQDHASPPTSTVKADDVDVASGAETPNSSDYVLMPQDSSENVTLSAHVLPPTPSRPIQPRAAYKSRPPPHPLELDDLNFGVRYNGPEDLESAPQTGYVTPTTPGIRDGLLESRPSSPNGSRAVDLVGSWSYPRMNKWRVLSVCLCYLGNGLSDAAPGALIPYIEQYYNIGYSVTSLIFVTNAVGFILAAFFTNIIEKRLGRSWTILLCEAFMIAAYVLIATTPPFLVVVVAFFLLGLGYATNLALNNVFLASLANNTVMLGLGHGSYGIGGILAPIIATSMVSKGVLWSRFYTIMIAVRVLSGLAGGFCFRSYEQEAPTQLHSELERNASLQNAEGGTGKTRLLKRALHNRVTLIGALFIFAYQGAEVSISGWVISFLINYRNGDPAHVGYVTAGFWAGITLGRFTLSHVCTRIGEKRSVYFLVAGSVVFQLLVWQVPNVVGDAVSVAILGLLLGPVYPCGQVIFAQLLPRNVMVTAIGFIAGAGSSGGAVAPFTTGVLAQARGTWVLHPVCIGLFCVMIACWVGLPRVHKRRE